MYDHSKYTSVSHAERGSNAYQMQGTYGQLMRLLCCILIFLAVFLGKGSGQENLLRAYDRLAHVISQSTDFEAVFRQLMDAIPDTSDLFHISSLSFAPTGIRKPEPSSAPPSQTSLMPELSIPTLESGYALARQREQGSLANFLYAPPTQIIPEPVSSESQTIQEEAAVPAVGTVLEYIEYPGEELPQRCTMHHISLGELDVVTPVLGHLNSGFGFRVHPIDGKHQFHAGVDLGGQYGDPIGAFADGIVDYIGEDDSYGLYTQLDHGNGVKSFYAHCQSLQVKQGQKVQAGEEIGTVGSSGSATGPHLHLELKWNGTYLNPLYYIEVLEE